MALEGAGRGLSVGWIVSILLHVGLLLAMAFYRPFREAVVKAATPQPTRVTASTETIRDVARTIQQANAGEMRSDIEQMRLVLNEMERLRLEKLREFEQSLRSLSTAGPQRAIEAQDRALEAQRQTLQRQRGTLEQQQQATNQQAAVTAAQEEAKRMLAAAGELMRPAADAQQQATAAQQQAANQQLVAQQAMNEVRDAQQRQAALQEQLTSVQSNRAEADAVANARRLASTESQQKHSQAVQELETARAASEAAAQAHNAASDDQKEPTAQALQRSKELQESAGRETDAARQHLEQSQRESNDADRRAQELARQADELHQRLETARAETADKVRAFEAPILVAANAQEQAMVAQQAARDALAAAAAQSPPGQAQSEPAPVAGTSPPRSAPAASDLRELPVAQLYDAAQAVETQVAESYRELRATELAMIRETSLDEALRDTEVPRPVRPRIDAALLASPASDRETLDRQKEQIQTAVRETDSMVGLAFNLIHTAVSDGSGAGTGVSVRVLPKAGGKGEAPPQQQPAVEQYRQMVAAAAEDEGAIAKDLTDLMAPPVGGPETLETSTEEMTSASLKPGEPGGPPAIVDPQNIGITVAGREVSRDGQPAEFLVVDAWYTIGPFANEDRQNITKVFPPETVVDLDAVYVGKDNQPIRWQFVQSSGPMLIPPDYKSYAIYYAYTELRFDEPRELWVAVGSDDYSRIWINDYLVWSSGMQHKGWKVNEGWRKVRFEKGLNRILFRVENGWNVMGWSMVLHTQPH